MGKAFEVPSELKRGFFPRGHVHERQAKPDRVEATHGGQVDQAVDTPLPILWASGGSMTPVQRAHWKSGDSSKSEAMRIDSKTKKPEWKKLGVPALSYPRVHQLCLNLRLCSPEPRCSNFC